MLNYYVNANGNQNRVTWFQQQSTYVLNNCTKHENTKLAYDPRKIEYSQYCDKCYPLDPNRYIVNEEYAYGFLCYNTYRE